jgi:hypothetical protein
VEVEIAVAEVDPAVDMTISRPGDDNLQEISRHQEADMDVVTTTIEGHTPDLEVHHLPGTLDLLPVDLLILLRLHCWCKMTLIERIFTTSKICLRIDEFALTLYM